jgi:hypothetical protein
MMESGMMKRGPTGPLAYLLHGAVLEAALYVAVSEDPARSRDEVWEGLERLLKGLLGSSGTE